MNRMMRRWWRFGVRARPSVELVAPERAPFMMSKNEREVQRLNEQHFAIREEMGGNFLAPLVTPNAILDIGCGTGRWAMEMAVEFPQAQVRGLDVVLTDPAASVGLGVDAVPPNVAFIEADATQPLPFPDASFAYVHLCMLYAVIPATAWEQLVRECIRVVQPGGWIESVEALAFSNPTERPGMATITTWFGDLLRLRGADPLVALKMAGWLRDGGLADVTTREITDRATVDDHEEAIAAATALIDYLRAPVIAAGIASADEFAATAERALAEVRRSSVGSGFNTYVTFGQRPALVSTSLSTPQG
jgi:ubiquinone/menaquinone biosynthesis C-methylase UbiE